MNDDLGATIAQVRARCDATGNTKFKMNGTSPIAAIDGKR